MKPNPLKDIVREYMGSVANLQRCLGHSAHYTTDRVLNNLFSTKGSLKSLNAVAECLGIPAWYLLMMYTADENDAAFRRKEEELIEDLERIKAHNRYAAWAYFVDLVRRGLATEKIRAWADTHL